MTSTFVGEGSIKAWTAFDYEKLARLGGSPGLVVMGVDSRSKGRGFESRRRILDGHDIFSHSFVVKIVLFV